MAMEKLQAIKDTGSKAITALTYNPVKHEIMAGCEDGSIKFWDYSTGEPGKLMRTAQEHEGWVTCFLFWPEARLMISAANDGSIVGWGSGGNVSSKASVSSPIYVMAMNARRNNVVAGVGESVVVYRLRDPSEPGDPLDTKRPFVSKEHTDIVKCIVCHEGRVYSAGYDRQFIVYDSSSYPNSLDLKVVTCVKNAHDAGISCLCFAKDNENNSWLFTGSFDKTVKAWSQDGQVMHKFDSFLGSITGLCYVRPSKTVWIASGSGSATMYDPKSGENVSDFIGTFQNSEETEISPSLMLMNYCNDLGQVFATNSRRNILIWKYNKSGCLTALKNKFPVESLTYTKKVPLLIFSGASDGQVTKWERLQSNNFMYSKDIFSRNEAMARLSAQQSAKHDWRSAGIRGFKGFSTRPPTIIGMKKGSNRATDFTKNISLLKTIFVESLDLLVCSSEDGNIYVWGFDESAVKVLKSMKPVDYDLTRKFEILLNNDRNKKMDDEVVEEQDSVTNRVAGFVCKQVFDEHNSCVTGLALMGRQDGCTSTFLISAGWDRRILLWDLEKLCFHDSFRNTDANGNISGDELASDGIILDLTYCSERNEFAYSASDKLVYIRQFSEVGSEMKLLAVLQGHEAEVTQVRWNSILNKWITGSEDGTIRVWSANGMSCDLTLSAQGSVSALCIDEVNGCIVAGVQDVIRVYDPDLRTIVQTNVGHADCVRSILHIPERSQYVSASWDKTIRIWNAYRKLQQRDKKRRVSQADSEEDEVEEGLDEGEEGLEEEDVIGETQGV